MEVAVSKDGTRNTYVRVKVRDEYSIVQEVESVIGEVLRQEGAMVEVQRVEAKKVLEQVQMIHVV
jgi:hypothetical protein